MKTSRLLSLFGAAISVFAVSLSAQTPSDAERVRQDRERKRVETSLDKRIRNMRELTETRREPTVESLQARAAHARSKSEWKAILAKARDVDNDVVVRYREFLDQKKTGIFTLLPNFDCATTLTIEVSAECNGFVPDTSDFSFRTAKYVGAAFHDISLNRDKLITRGFFSHGTLIKLGDVPIEYVNLETDGVKALTRIEPDRDISTARQTARKLVSGFTASGFWYANSADAAVDTTYALRVVAYRLSNTVPLYHEQTYKTQREFGALTDRDIVTVVFRVASVDSNGKLTIVWKELSRTDAPKLKFGKGEEWTDIWP
jgi:hypothetical protein